MKVIPPSIQRLIGEFNKLPGIGAKTSERFVYYLLRQPKSEADALAQSLLALNSAIQLCSDCYTFSEEDVCQICTNSSRSKETICVVAEPKDVIALEKAAEYEGVYHVLGGLIDHSFGVGPQHLRIDELLKRVADSDGKVTEVILATNPNMEGDTTALYISQQLSETPVKLTKIARGLPVGADIEFADEVTLGNALSGRQEM